LPANFCRQLQKKLFAKHVELRADDLSREILDSKLKNQNSKLRAVSEQDYFTEYNDYILNVRVVDGVRAAIDHINFYSSAHSDSIVTKRTRRTQNNFSPKWIPRRFIGTLRRVSPTAANLAWAREIGISTDKIGARGPMGLDELTSYKWLGIGNGQIRN